jgi:integrase
VSRRHHIHQTVIQKQIKIAAEKAAINKRVTSHTLRHYAEFQIMPSCFLKPFENSQLTA